MQEAKHWTLVGWVSFWGLVGFVGWFVFLCCSKNPDPNKLAILRTYTPLLYRFIHPSIGGSLLILGVVGFFGKKNTFNHVVDEILVHAVSVVH